MPQSAATLQPSDDDALADLCGVIEHLALQIEQMRGMFDDSDGAIAGALQDAEDANEVLGRLRGRLTRAAALQPEPAVEVPHVILTIADGMLASAISSRPVRVTVLDGDVPEDFGCDRVVLNGDVYQRVVADVFVSATSVQAIEHQIEHSASLIDAFSENNGGVSESAQEALDDLVITTVLEGWCAKWGDLTDDQVSEAESEASQINNRGINAQITEIVCHGDISQLRKIAGLDHEAPQTPSMG